MLYTLPLPSLHRPIGVMMLTLKVSVFCSRLPAVFSGMSVLEQSLAQTRLRGTSLPTQGRQRRGELLECQGQWLMELTSTAPGVMKAILIGREALRVNCGGRIKGPGTHCFDDITLPC